MRSTEGQGRRDPQPLAGRRPGGGGGPRGSLAWFYGHGVADVTSNTPVDQDTVFRIASITKTITAIAVMQLWEQGLVDLDAPASDYLRDYRLIPARPSFRPATLRHLLTHTAGVRAVRKPSDLLRPALGWGAPAGRPVPSLAEYYRGGLRVDVEPGTKWAYSNHGFATLGQIVEDVSGLPLDRYLREHVFGPLGMEQLRPGPVRAGAAPPGHRVRSCAPAGSRRSPTARWCQPVAARSTPPPATWPATSPRCWAAALTSTAAVLQPETLATMFEPHYQPDPRIPGMGLGFFRGQAGGHRTVGHDGIWNGFHSAMRARPRRGHRCRRVRQHRAVQPARRARARSPTRSCAASSTFPTTPCAPTSPSSPRAWGELCGWYSLGPGVLTDPQPGCSAGVEVAVRHDHLTIRGQIPVPAVRRGLRLHPDGDDPYVFRIDLPGFGSGTSPVVFSRDPGGEVTGHAPRRAAAVLPEAARHPEPQAVGRRRAGGRRHSARGRSPASRPPCGCNQGRKNLNWTWQRSHECAGS